METRVVVFMPATIGSRLKRLVIFLPALVRRIIPASITQKPCPIIVPSVMEKDEGRILTLQPCLAKLLVLRAMPYGAGVVKTASRKHVATSKRSKRDTTAYTSRMMRTLFSRMDNTICLCQFVRRRLPNAGRSISRLLPLNITVALNTAKRKYQIGGLIRR